VARRRLVLIATAVVLGGAPACLWAVPANAAAPEKHGWWTVTNTGFGVAPPAPPQVPSGGLYIENGFTGPTAISALTFQVAAGDEVGSITLKVAGNPVITSPPIACPITAAGQNYKPAQGGPWSEVPAYDCTKSQVTGTVSSDSTTVTFAAGPLLENGTVAAVIKAGGSADQVAFDQPGPDALAVTPAGGPSGGVTGVPAGSPATQGASSPVGIGDNGSSGSPAPAAPSSPLSLIPAAPAAGTPPALASGAPSAVSPTGGSVTGPPSASAPTARQRTQLSRATGSGSSVRKDLAEAIGIAAVLAALVAYSEGFGLLGGRINRPAARQRATRASSEA
jgi:hypothetical protein